MAHEIKIFFVTGQSGSGKNTLCDKLADQFTENGSDVLLIDNGKLLRQYEQGPSYFAQLSKERSDAGLLSPLFVLGMVVGSEFERNLTPDTVIIWNGSPRSDKEKITLPEIVEFLKADATIIVLEASDETCMNRIKARNAQRGMPERKDSNNDASLKNKLEWYHSQTKAVIAVLEENPLFAVLRLDAEGTAEEVFAEAITKLGLE